MIGVLVSGEGTNLQALLDAGLPVVAVASNVAGTRAIGRAQAAGVPAAVFPAEEYADRDARDSAMADWLQEHGVELVVCAGYMQLLRPSFLSRFPGRVVNVHPAPLPAFPGAHPLDDVRRQRDRARAFAHVTGGGILGNLTRVLPEGLRPEIDWEAWERPPVFRWLARHVAEDELRRVFNLGVGYLAIVPDPGDELVVGRIVRA